MSIVRIAKRSRYTVIDNTVINDKSLDFDALGLLVYLLSKPDHWDVSITHLARQKKSGESKIKRMLKELQKQGYAVWTRLSSGKTEWTIYEKPQVENQLKGEPQVEKPHEEKPHVENQGQVNTDNKVNTEKTVKKKKKKKKSQPDMTKVIEPDNLNTVAWSEWMTYKQAINKEYSSHIGINKAMKTLSKLPHENQQNCIDEAIGREWEGFFIERHTGASNGNSHNQKRETTGERINREANEAIKLAMGNDENQIPEFMGGAQHIKLVR